MRIIVKRYLPSEWKADLKEKIENKEIRTWEFVMDGGHERLLHTGDKQYRDVVIKFVPPTEEDKHKKLKYTQFVPIICENVKSEEERDIAKSHLGIVLGRFAEVLNCHYAGVVKTYQILL